MKSITTYFPSLTAEQKQQFEALSDLYADWNAKINVISRKDIQNLYPHHVLHSLAIARYIRFTPGSTILDVGTGGGFPGIPLAIFFPEVQFVLLDSIGKKVRVAKEVSQAVGLKNVETVHARVEEEKRKFHFIVSRAVMPLPELVRITRKNISREQINALPNGIICLKGGDLSAELYPYRQIAELVSLSDYFSESFFQTKKLVYLPLS
ncbi:MAG: 16S rRNA (guanine(527)-N(7))-methyltransferase RsmG [Proteiniphilum sp.]|uniref:16S rRNA (guanine(527)-N(7))-methyltransferase RsmG n=1 Tax=Proteiniphilum sp. TaxID=1926877 RepID=UPI000928F656|nr:16S rRNA (guanine(527)-N(7))-methyltransferase RsmG [Proteiniphilum sp.]MEA5129733.1 16S rRNA (guanine(527)-N(7))-methyltransferase RsmG [Proteiniphilum sp.]OJV80645.1 MAG: 16S rRNA (guanine(527)-N(7))-methyltransferase RsmG [Bacteroidia bacterium 44-10]